MLIVSLIGGVNYEVKMSAYDFKVEFNEALKDRKAMDVVTPKGTVYLNPDNIITFSETISC